MLSPNKEDLILPKQPIVSEPVPMFTGALNVRGLDACLSLLDRRLNLPNMEIQTYQLRPAPAIIKLSTASIHSEVTDSNPTVHTNIEKQCVLPMI